MNFPTLRETTLFFVEKNYTGKYIMMIVLLADHTILIDVYSSRSFFCLILKNSVLTIAIDGKKNWSKRQTIMVV